MSRLWRGFAPRRCCAALALAPFVGPFPPPHRLRRLRPRTRFAGDLELPAARLGCEMRSSWRNLAWLGVLAVSGCSVEKLPPTLVVHHAAARQPQPKRVVVLPSECA